MDVWCGVSVSIVFDRRKVEKRSDGSLGKAGKWNDCKPKESIRNVFKYFRSLLAYEVILVRI